MGDIPRCPANGLERAAHFRKEAALHKFGGYWHARLLATALCIEMRHQRDTKEPTLPFTNPIDLLIGATVLRQAAADEDAPAARDEMIAWARQLESEAMGGHVTAPRQ